MGKVPVSFALINTFLDSRTVPLPEAEQVVTDVFGRISSGWTAPSTVRDEIEWDGVEIWPDPDGMDN